MPRALDRITVLDISVGEACALATMILSDNGARVIRVTDPTDERIGTAKPTACWTEARKVYTLI